MDSSSSTSAGAAAPSPSLSPGSQEVQSVLPAVNVTRLPASVTNLVECVGHEIEMIKEELNQCYDNNNNNDNGNNDNEEEERLESLEDAIDDGFMCVDLRVLERKLEVWHHLFSPSLSNNDNETVVNNSKGGDEKLNYTVTPFFAVKCNPDPVVVEWLARSASRANLPLGFDCASIAELELAQKHVQTYSLESWGETDSSGAVPTTRIVYANPQRAEADLIKALELFATPLANDACASPCSTNDLWLTLDGVEEVYKIAIAKKRFLEKHSRDSKVGSHHHQPLAMPQIKIILRIWVPDGHSQVPLGEKFGMRLDQIDAVVEACLEHGIAAREIIGISFHCGSGCESVETYLEALEMGKTALQAMDRKLLLEAPPLEAPDTNRYRCWLLDIGGGFPGLDGLYGDEGRFAAATASLASTTRTAAAAAASNHAMEEKKEGDVPTQPQTTVADIAMAVRPVLQSFSNNGNNGHSNDDDGSARQESKTSNDKEQNPPLTLIAEPGRYFVEGAFALASRIYQKQIQEIPTELSKENNKENGNDSEGIRVYRIPHGVQGVFKDVLLCGESFVPQPLQSESLETNDEENETQNEEDSPLQVPNQKSLYLSKVLGPSGDDSEDVVCESCWLPELQVGDWLVFDRMGAYTLSIASRAGRPVMRYVIGGEINHKVSENEE